MREKSIEQFEALFERASIPVLHIERVPLARIAAVCKNDPLDASALRLARHLHARFGSRVDVFFSRRAGRKQIASAAAGFDLHPEPFDSTAELVGQLTIAGSELLILPEPADAPARVVKLDELVLGSAPPVLVFRQPIDDPRAVFARILHTLSGNFTQTRNFSYSFTLVEDGGQIELLHVIDQTELEPVCQTLRLSPQHAGDADALITRVQQLAEKYLRAVVSAARPAPCEVGYRLAVGPVVETVQTQLAASTWGLLVVGRHDDTGRSHVNAQDYQLLHRVREVPVLAL